MIMTTPLDAAHAVLSLPTSTITWGILALAAGTFAVRLAGFGLGRFATASPRRDRMLTQLTAVLLVAVVATGALGREGDPGLAVGVGIGGLAAALRAPLAVVVLLAATATALVRLFVG